MMDKDVRNAIERATQKGRRILEEDFAEQLDGVFDVRADGRVAEKGGKHLTGRQHLLRDKIVAAIEHKRSVGMKPAEAVADYVRDAAFTTLNRFVALKMLEPRDLVLECISRGDASSGFAEFCGLAQAVKIANDAGYRLYIESIFDELSTEVKVLFDRRDAASVLWPKKATFDELLVVLNAEDLKGVWSEDETIGWVYQFFNSGEERRKMRDESQAPRNSRELAIRNQFFTPQYVVQFLCDNTLGRIWYEMRKGDTRLGAFCEYMVKPPEESVLAKKDPRDIRIIDPACGSGHFLLYCFILLLLIYEESWADETAPGTAATGRTLRSDYPTLEALRKAAPELILLHNLHGVDIDPRCAQIAQLALWMRAQRAFKEAGIHRSERPIIRRANIVIAEPMPGDLKLVGEFAATLRPAIIGKLFEEIVSEMRLAGEMGSLLQIERKLAISIERARVSFAEQQTHDAKFLPGLAPVKRQAELDLSGIDNSAFFEKAEEQIFASLKKFVRDAVNGLGTRRKLFADDAEQGIAFVELMGRKFDVALMNPPFGAGSLVAKKEFEKSYPRTKNDVYAAFVERGVELLYPHGMLGAITSRTGFFLSSFQKWREEILLKEAPPVVFADLGYGVLDSAMVEVAAYCLEKNREVARMKTIFLRALEADDKAGALRAAIRQPEAARGKRRFELDPSSFAAVPRAPFAYWVSARIRGVFSSFPSFELGGRIARRTNSVDNDFRYVRLAWEAPVAHHRRWVPWAKGGSFSKYYSDVHTTIAWSYERGTYPGFLGTPSRPLARPASAQLFFRSGLTWPRRTQAFGPRVMPLGCIFGDKGPAAFITDDNSTVLLALLAVLSSAVVDALISMSLNAADATARSYEVGVIQRIPIPNLTAVEESGLATLARRAWSLKRSIDTRIETSHAFTLPILLQVTGDTLSARADIWAEHLRAIEADLAAIQTEIDARCFAVYGIDETDRNAITEGFVADDGRLANTETENHTDSDTDADGDEEGDTEDNADEAVLAAELVSWMVGVAVGRFDVRLGTGARPLPAEPGPFDPLPVCSAAMLIGDDGLPLTSAPAGYPLAFPENGILVDDRGHARDLTDAVRLAFDEVFKASADKWWDEAGALLDPQGHNIRAWLASGYFEHHLKCHSKSRRKVPIVWQIAVPSRRYSIWLYAHRVSRDSLIHIQNDILTPKLAHEERHLTSLVQSAGANSNAKERKEIEAQEAFVGQLRELLEEVMRVVPMWHPSLDDGVSLTMAPLWRLVPQHKPWQRELKSHWDELVAGKYDWARLAMHLWPERVIPKCAKDRSLAIAHGLEEVFWFEDEQGKWKPCKKPQKPIADLVRERTSTAVKAALKSLLDAPEPASGSKRSRKAQAA